MKNLDPKGEGFLDDKVAYTEYAIDNDAFDVREFENLKAHSAKLLQTESKGTKDYEQFPQLQQDLYDALFKYAPELNEDWQIQRDFLLNKKIIEQLMDGQRYKELRVMTNLDVVNSVIGAELMSDEALQLVKNAKEQRDRLQEMVDAGNQMDQAAAGGQGPGGANAKDPNALTLEEAKEAYEKAMERFQESVTREEFKRDVDKLAAKVKDTVKETSDMISNWGLESSGSFQRRSAHEKMSLLQKLRSGKLKQIAQMAGRFRKLYQLNKKERVKTGIDETYSVQQGSNIARLVASEMLRFLHPLTRMRMMADLLEGKTLEYQIRGKQRKGKGPIIICIDSSGSMSGLPEVWSKAVALVLLEIAREQKRDFYCIHFSSGYRKLHTNEFPKNAPFEIEQLIDMAEYFEAGGTEFEPPLNLARQKIGVEAQYSKADIVFVTDGQSVVRDEWMVEFKKWKKENKVNIYSILIDAWDNADSTLKQFSDRIDKLSNLKESQETIALDLLLDM